MRSSRPVITRFAPSPTGFLHVGGARTALFNWLYAKHLNGKMLLRIEDTDTERSTQQAIDAIINGLTWLGLDWYGSPILQSSRLIRHQEIAQNLLQNGHAYYCYATPDELLEMREKAFKSGKKTFYDGRWREPSMSTPIPNRAPVIRIKIPKSGCTRIDDPVQGVVNFQNADLDDFILLRSDGTPTYMLAVVVDDHDMGVTHIIRGDDHLTNAARQSLIYKALNWDIPVMAHIPLIHGQDGAKLSKRENALDVLAYKQMGFLPEALRNYLVRLGWSHGDHEIMSDTQLIEWFDIKDVNKAAACFDFKKLESINSHYIKNKKDTELYRQSLELFSSIEGSSFRSIADDPSTMNRYKKALPFLKNRVKTLRDFLDCASFIFGDFASQPDASSNEINPINCPVLKMFLEEINTDTQWSYLEIELLIKAFLKKNNLKMRHFAPNLRVALTGKTDSLGITDLLYILGQDEVKRRLLRQITKGNS